MLSSKNAGIGKLVIAVYRISFRTAADPLRSMLVDICFSYYLTYYTWSNMNCRTISSPFSGICEIPQSQLGKLVTN